jgi:hypothetical protein
MGFDIYLEWKGQTDEEKDAQITGWENAGSAGYLRESYGQDSFGCELLFSEAWKKRNGARAKIQNSKLKERMPAVVKLLKDAGEPDSEIQHWRDFVKLHGKLERTNKEPRIAIR